MGESFQDYSWIQDNSFSDIFSVCLRTFDHLNLNCEYLLGILQILRFEFWKFRILEILNFHPCKLAEVEY